MARIQNTARNTTFALLGFIIQIIMQFAVRTVFIWKLGSELLGLDSLFLNVIQVLCLAELGIGSAICFSMYKPAANGDVEGLKSLNALYKKAYIWIAVVIFVVGIAITPLLPFLMDGTPQVGVSIYIVYFVFLASTLISYFAAHKRSLLFVYQRNDIQSNVATVRTVLVKGFQIAALFIFKDYYIYLAVMVLGIAFESITILQISNKLYPLVNGKAGPLDKEVKKTVTKNIVAMSMHKVGGTVIFSLSNIFISAFFGLVVLGTAANYLLIYSNILIMLGLLATAVQGSIGNMVAKESVDDNYKMFKTLFLGFSMIIGFCTVCLLCLYQPFIALWLGESWLLQFSVVISIVIRFYVISIRTIPETYKTCAGLMWNDKWKPIIEIIVNIGLTILFINLFGLIGIFLATIASTVLVPLWVEPYVLFKNYFKKSMWLHLIRVLVFTIATTVAAGASWLLCSLLPFGFWFLVARLAICGAVTLFTYTIFFCSSPEAKHLMKIAKSLLPAKKKNTMNGS